MTRQPKPMRVLADAMIVSAGDLYPHRERCKDRLIAFGATVEPDGSRGSFRRTSLIVNGSLEWGFIETMNTIYIVV